METGFESWKLAKGIYIIPLLFVYTPILFEGSVWQVLETTITVLIGLFSLTVFFEGMQLVCLNWPMSITFIITGVLLLWPQFILHGIGLAVFALLLFMKKASPALAGGSVEPDPSR